MDNTGNSTVKRAAEAKEIYKQAKLDAYTSITEKLTKLPTSLQLNNPLNKLTGTQKVEWDELKEAIKAGKLNHLSLNEIHRQVCKHFDVKIPRTTFRDTLAREGVKKPK